MVDEYISRGALNVAIHDSWKSNPHNNQISRQTHNHEHRHFLKLLHQQPTADVVEVVRCKYCKHYEIHKPSVTLNCEREGRLIPMNPDDFCSYGEKKDGKRDEEK